MSEIDFYSKLINIEEAVELGTNLANSWFRGHSKAYGKLTPGIFRKEYSGLAKLLGEKIELHIAEKFKQRAPALSKCTPGKKDHLEWLFLMQHHGTPTRLLDWTENVLVALFFAVHNNIKEDGELWAIFPDELNFCSIKLKGIQLPVSRYINYLASVPFHNNTEELKRSMNIPNDILGPLAFYPPLNFLRMVNQMSVFTIHPDPKESKTIDDLLVDKQYIVRYKIPSEYKQSIMKDLHYLGIRESILFPGLDSLSNTIKHEIKNRRLELPEPPKFRDP